MSAHCLANKYWGNPALWLLSMGQCTMLVTDARGGCQNLKRRAPPLKIKLSTVLCTRALGVLRYCIVILLDLHQSALTGPYPCSNTFDEDNQTSKSITDLGMVCKNS